MPCEICGRNPTQVHHWFTRGAFGPAALIPENEIELCVLLPNNHHPEAHSLGRESFAGKYGLGKRVRKAEEVVRARHLMCLSTRVIPH